MDQRVVGTVPRVATGVWAVDRQGDVGDLRGIDRLEADAVPAVPRALAMSHGIPRHRFAVSMARAARATVPGPIVS
ncbi:hypothetical protein MKK65_25320 [Methylobacterium sp. J-001]|uniref:hypothetical protein n=1 Tax=Methylobacterium sp. J-001 TaxID=2836609 RepID=UPI001FBBA687|nr:hypothetical protein [Methylobacterium sp. J-001]MCJ2119850.1 hypothetical protein [Methylobacterium sp. J-001]